MNLTEEDIRVLQHHYRVKAACEDAQGNYRQAVVELNNVSRINLLKEKNDEL